MKQLSKDYRLASLYSIVGVLMTLVFIHLPDWIDNNYFWQVVCYSLTVSLIVSLAKTYINVRKLAMPSNKPSKIGNFLRWNRNK